MLSLNNGFMDRLLQITACYLILNNEIPDFQ